MNKTNFIYDDSEKSDLKLMISTDKEEPRWLELFNEFKGYNFQMFDLVDESMLEKLSDDIYKFNNDYACGPAIYLTKIPN